MLGNAKACVHLWCKLAVDLAAVGVVFRYKKKKAKPAESALLLL